MEAHIIEIVRFLVCLSAVIVAVAVMIKLDDNDAVRRLTAALAAALIFFNQQIGVLAYLLLGSVLETLIAVMGVAFVVVLVAVIAFFPLVAMIRWVIH